MAHEWFCEMIRNQVAYKFSFSLNCSSTLLRLDYNELCLIYNEERVHICKTAFSFLTASRKEQKEEKGKLKRIG